MWNWLDKAPLLKLFDVGLILFILGLLLTMIYFMVKSLKKIGEPTLGFDDKGKVKFSLNPKENSTLELLLKSKDEEIEKLRLDLRELSDRFAVLDAQVNKDRIISDYHKDHKVPLIEHSVFFNLKKNYTGGIDLDIDNKDPIINTKIQIARIFLEQCKMPIFYERLKEWVKGFDDCTTDAEALQRLYGVLEHLYAWIDEYSIKAESILVELEDGRTFRGIPQSFIDSFNEWHEPHVKIVVYKIKDILYNQFYATWQLKLIVILDHIDTAFYLTIKDAEKTIETINGKVEKQIQEKLKSLKDQRI
ncbi:MAG: hypothetical protein AB7V16_06965 [Vulcanibacillus sp.]